MPSLSAAGSIGSGAILEEIGKDTAPLGASSPPALTFNGNGWLQVAVQGLDQSLDYYWMPSLNLASPTCNLVANLQGRGSTGIFGSGHGPHRRGYGHHRPGPRQ